MGTIRKKGDLQWHAQVRRRGYPAQTATFISKRDAETWVASTEAEMLRGVFVSREVAERTTLAQALERFGVEVSPSHKGHLIELQKIRALCKHPICSRFLANLQAIDFARYRDERLKTRKPATVVRELALMHRVFEVGRKEWGFNIDNPVSMVEKPKVRNARSRRLSPDEEARLMRELQAQERGPGGTYLLGGTRNIWVRAVVRFALATAMRKSEILGLKWADVDVNQRVAILWDTKNGDRRDVPLSPEALEVLKGLPRALSGRVFDTTIAAVTQAFEGAKKRAELVDFRFHDLRHEAIVRLSRKLPNTIELSMVSGHKDPKMLKRYYNVTAAELAVKLA